MQRAMRIKGNIVTDTLSCRSDSSHIYEYVLLFNERPDISGTWISDPIEPPTHGDNASSAYDFLKNVESMTPKSRRLMAHTPSAKVDIELKSLPKGTKIYRAEASGITANPTISVGNAAVTEGSRPCYPLIIRIPANDATVTSRYTLSEPQR